jgi:hypothetical protein
VGATQFHGLDGTHVIPAGYVAWDATGYTNWDTSSKGRLTATDSFQDWTVYPILSDGNLTATTVLESNKWPIPIPDFGVGSKTWVDSIDYAAGSFVSDIDEIDFYNANVSLFYGRNFHAADPGFGNEPFGNNSWETAVVCCRSTTFKERV